VAWTSPTSLLEDNSRPSDQTTIPIKLGALKKINVDFEQAYYKRSFRGEEVCVQAEKDDSLVYIKIDLKSKQVSIDTKYCLQEVVN
jgi:hypothetical protein